MKAVWKWIVENRATIVSTLVAAMLIVAVLTSALTAVCGSVIALPQDETCAQCIRSWVGALSGWFAALVGGVAAFAAFKTVRAVRDQIRANREDSQRFETETKSVLDATLYDIFKELELGWRLLDERHKNHMSEEDRQRAIALSRHYILNALPPQSSTGLKLPLSFLDRKTGRKLSRYSPHLSSCFTSQE